MIAKLVQAPAAALGPLHAMEVRDIAFVRVDVQPECRLVLEAAQKATFAVERGQARLDHLAALLGAQLLGHEDVAVVVHRPDGISQVPDDLLADEVAAAEVAVAIGELPLLVREIDRARTSRLDALSITGVGGGLGLDDESLQPSER